MTITTGNNEAKFYNLDANYNKDWHILIYLWVTVITVTTVTFRLIN